MAANRPAPRQPLVTRFNITVPPAMQLDAARSWMAISPSGSQIVFVGGASGNTKLYSRGLGEDSIRVIPGTDAVITAAFSADGAWILFRTFDRALKKVPASGGTPTVVAAGVGVAAWGANGDIVYGTTFGDGMWLLPAGARQAQARRLTVVDSASGEVFDGRAAFLPSGKAVLSTVTRGGTRDWRLVAVKLDGTVKRFDVTGVYPTYVDPGYVLFSSAPGQISIAPFDADRLEFTGSPTPVLEGVASLPGGGPILAVSPDGKVLSYLRGLPDSRFAFVTEGGQTTTLAGDARRFRHLRVSPDGKRILTEIVKDDGSRDIWVFEVASATLTRVTFDGQSSDPIWSPEGKRIAYARTANSVDGVDVVVVNADGSGSPEVIVGGPGGQWPCEWTPDGKGFVFDELVRGSLMRVMELRDGARREIVAAAEYSARLPAISPDGRWIAYTSNETGGVEVYVRPMGAKTAGKSRVSTAGGTQPVWSPDGTTLYYRDDQAMTVVAAPMIVTESGISAGPRRPFAADRYALENTINYSTMPDGKRLVFLVPTGDAARFGVVVNWIDEVKAKLAAARAK
jgi:Tol biopolymer transport system component